MTPAPLYDKAGRLRRQTPYKRAIIQAMRFELGIRTTEIAAKLNVKPQDVSRQTVMESHNGVPWECRPDWQRERAIEAARRILDPS